MRQGVWIGLVMAIGCGGAMTPTTPTAAPTPAASPAATTPSGPPTIRITADGLQPREVTIAAGDRVTFANVDVRSHDLVGGPDPDHPDCPEITTAGFLTPGQSRDAGPFTTPHTCEYHDHTAMGVAAYQGRVVIR